MALHTEARDLATTEFCAALAELGIAQCRVARWFGVGPRSVRRWRHGDRRVPRGAEILLRLLTAGAVTIDQVEQAAAPVPARTNGDAKPKPPAPRPVEPAPEQSALASALTDPSLTTAEKIVALAPNACRWPYNDPRHPNFYFCSRPTAAPPYCNEHRIAAHITPRPQQAPVGGQKPSKLRVMVVQKKFTVNSEEFAPHICQSSG
jgi:GcrA cell cycle regulator